jgi:hypothetical protein
MREDKLQSLIAVKFSQKYPNKEGQLFHVSNERNNKIQAYKARAIGIIPGVADFIYFDDAFNVATELKVPGSRHEVAKVRKQIKWGRTWERKGNVWRLCRTVKEAMSCYKGKFKGLTLDEVEKMLDSVKTKTIKF